MNTHHQRHVVELPRQKVAITTNICADACKCQDSIDWDPSHESHEHLFFLSAESNRPTLCWSAAMTHFFVSDQQHDKRRVGQETDHFGFKDCWKLAQMRRWFLIIGIAIVCGDVFTTLPFRETHKTILPLLTLHCPNSKNLSPHNRQQINDSPNTAHVFGNSNCITCIRSNLDTSLNLVTFPRSRTAPKLAMQKRCGNEHSNISVHERSRRKNNGTRCKLRLWLGFALD